VEKNQEIPFISIVVCTYNRKNLLKECLTSIYLQDYPKSRFEIIVVDGGSTDGTKELCREEFPSVRLVIESKGELAHARNRGAELASGSIVAFTDDDCIVDKDWVKNLAAGFRFSRRIMGVGGPVYPLYPEMIPNKIYVKAALGLYCEGEELKLTQCIITSNAAFKKEIFNATKFNEKLAVTRKKKSLSSGEDVAFCESIIRSGHQLLYTPYARAYHQVRKDMLRVPYIIKRAFYSGITQTRIWLSFSQSRIWAIRYGMGQLIQQVFRLLSDRSFASCYRLTYYMSALLGGLTGIDKII